MEKPWNLNKLLGIDKKSKKPDELAFPSGHYYSPIDDIQEAKNRQLKIWDEKLINPLIQGVDLNLQPQLELLSKFSDYYKDIPFEAERIKDLRYYFNNEMYSYSDAIILYSMIRHFKPARIIEVGSGFSSAVMLDTNEMFFDNSIDLTFIEPYPDRLKSLLREGEKINLVEKKVQDVAANIVDNLKENDILFIDSSHVSKTGSDLNYLIFDVLPRLKKGVKIHFHDIFHPFEYPKDWVINEGRSWNENYLIRSFLSNNNKFRIVLFCHYLHQFYKNHFEEDMPLCLKNSGGNLWLEVS